MSFDRTKILNLYQSGLTLEEVGDRIGCSHTTVWTTVKKAGIMRGPGPARQNVWANFRPKQTGNRVIAYYAGALASRGRISKEGIALSVPPLSEHQLQEIEQFALGTKKRKRSFGMAIRGHDDREVLSYWGLHAGSSKLLSIPGWVRLCPPVLEFYLRGWWEFRARFGWVSAWNKLDYPYAHCWFPDRVRNQVLNLFYSATSGALKLCLNRNAIRFNGVERITAYGKLIYRTDKKPLNAKIRKWTQNPLILPG